MHRNGLLASSKTCSRLGSILYRVVVPVIILVGYTSERTKTLFRCNVSMQEREI